MNTDDEDTPSPTASAPSSKPNDPTQTGAGGAPSIGSEMTPSDPTLGVSDSGAPAPVDPEPNPEPSTPDPDLAMPDGGVPNDETVTWHGQIAPLFSAHCSGCHRTGGIAPFSFETYEVASAIAPAALHAIEEGEMPPWGAQDTDECTPPFAFKDDPRLSPDEVSLLQRWIDEGTPLGDPDNAAPLPSAPPLELEDPTQNIAMNSTVTIDGPSDEFFCFSLDPGLDEDVWVTATQVNPGNDAIVHHVLVYVDPDGYSADLAGDDGVYPCFGGPGFSRPQLLAAWAPGAVPARTPEGAAMHVPAGSRLVMNVHYHPTANTSETDSSTSIDLKFDTEEPASTAVFVLAGNLSSESAGLLPGENDADGVTEFRIPAGESAHVETQQIAVSPILSVLGAEVFAVGTHMHLLGKDMKISFERSDGTSQCLLQTPDWDFDWQRSYYYDTTEALKIERGDVLTMRCTYDNTLDHAGTAEALEEQGLEEPIDVYLGEESLDEMCLGVFGVTIPGAWSASDILSQL